jgi:heme oxygenase
MSNTLSLRELTATEHAAAENTPFMRLLFAKAATEKEIQAYITQMTLVYAALEPIAEKAGILTDFSGIARLPNIRKDLAEINAKVGTPAKIYWETIDYYNYLIELTDVNKIKAHFYVRYAGDMFGGQMLKSLVPGAGLWYEFDNLPVLRQKMRELAVPELAGEAKDAFYYNTQIIARIA